MVYTLCFFSTKYSFFHNSNIFDSCIIHILYTGCAKIKKKTIPSPKGNKIQYCTLDVFVTSDHRNRQEDCSSLLWYVLNGILIVGGVEWTLCSAGCAHYANFGAPSCVNIIKDGKSGFWSRDVKWSGVALLWGRHRIWPARPPPARPPRYTDSFINLGYWKIWRRHCCMA